MEISKEFNNASDEVALYKMKYFKNKEKYNITKELNNKIREEKCELQKKYEKLVEEYEIEKKLRKKYEEKLSNYLKLDPSIYKNNYNNSDLNRIPSNIPNDNFRIELGSNLSKYEENSEILDNTISYERENDYNLNSTNLKEKTLKEITNKFDIEILKKSLTVDFLEYDKDTLAIRRKILSREEKVNKIEKLLKTWFENSENLKKNIDYVINALTIFNEQFAKDLEIFDECPDLISMIYVTQNVLSDLINQFRIFASSVDNSFTHQIKNFLTITIPEYKDTKQSLLRNSEEFLFNSYKFLNTKKIQIKEHTKDSYNSLYRVYEFTRYDYINKINIILLFTKVDLPEKVSLFIYSLMVLNIYLVFV